MVLPQQNIEYVASRWPRGTRQVKYGRPIDVHAIIMNNLKEQEREISELEKRVQALEEDLDAREEVPDEATLLEWQATSLIISAMDAFLSGQLSDEDKEALKEYGIDTYKSLFYADKDYLGPTEKVKVARKAFNSIEEDLRFIALALVEKNSELTPRSSASITRPKVDDGYLQDYLTAVFPKQCYLTPLQKSCLEHLRTTANKGASCKGRR